jgi:hypothetical protein
MIKRSNTQPQTNAAAIAARMKTTALDQLANGGSARLAMGTLRPSRRLYKRSASHPAAMEDAAFVHDPDLVADVAGEAKVLLDHPRWAD